MFCIFIVENQNITKSTGDDYKNLSEELSKNLRLPSVGEDGIRHRNRPGRLSESKIMIILVCYYFGPRRIIAFSTTNQKPCLSILKIPPN